VANGDLSRLLPGSGVGVLGQNEVLDESDTEELSSVLEAGGDIVILWRGFRRAGGVVVGNNHCGGIVLECTN